jgi:hypothetical protein
MKRRRLDYIIHVTTEGQRVVDRDSKTLYAARDWNADGSDVDCCDRLLDSLTCVGADDHRLGLVRVQEQSIQIKAAMDCVKTVGQVQQCFSVRKCNVYSCVSSTY